MTNIETIESNRLLAAIAPGDMKRIAAGCELVPMTIGQSIYESGKEFNYVYFPTSSVISMLQTTSEGDSTEIAVVGAEGLAGVTTYLGGSITLGRAIVQAAGNAIRMSCSLLQKEFDRGGSVQGLLLRFAQALLTQMAQTAVCNRHHVVDERLCRWLLLMADRLPSDQLWMTQQLIADMLGVRREGVTAAAGKLQRSGWIRYRRGSITIVDRKGLETGSCECYATVRREYVRLLGARSAAPGSARSTGAS